VDLNEYLIEQHRLGRSPVLVIDEAQNLSIESLEAVRLLSNFETTHAKLLQILLSPARAADKLNAFELRQLKAADCVALPHQRARPRRRASTSGTACASPGATDAGILRRSRATDHRVQPWHPRVINTPAITAYQWLCRQQAEVDVRMVENAIEYLEDGEQPRWKRRAQARLTPSPQWVWAAVGGVAALVVALLP